MGVGAESADAVASKNAGFHHLITDSRPWYKNPRILQLNLLIAVLLINSSTNGYDGSMMNGLQSTPQWENAFNHPNSGKLGLLNAIQNIGSLAAYPFAPYLADGLGRRLAIVIGALIMILGTIFQAASHSVGMFIGARFLIGFGLTFAGVAAPLLVTEIAYPTQRAQATSMYSTLWYLGSIIAAWVTFGTFQVPSSWAWRIPSALQALPAVIQLFFIWFIPESPRWLVNKGREAQALETLAYYHGNGNPNDPLVQYEFEEIKAAIDFEKNVVSNIGWTTLFKTPGNRRRMRIIIAIAIFCEWSGNGLVSYYLNKVFIAIGITDNKTQLLINGILNIFNFIVAVIAGFLCEKVGRRRLFLTSTIGMFVSWTVQTASFGLYAQTGNTAAAHTVIAMIFLFYGFYDLAFTPLSISYSVEILPYALRAKGFVVFNFTDSISIIINQYVNPIALNKLGWKYYLVYVVWLIVEILFCYFFIIETKNLSLEETAALFDGDDKVAMLAEKAAENAGLTHNQDMHEKQSSGIDKVESIPSEEVA